MYTATKREIIKFMRNIDMSTPHTMSGLMNILRNNNNRYWFEEEKIQSVLTRLNAEKVYFDFSEKPYYKILNWQVR